MIWSPLKRKILLLFSIASNARARPPFGRRGHLIEKAGTMSSLRHIKNRDSRMSVRVADCMTHSVFVVSSCVSISDIQILSKRCNASYNALYKQNKQLSKNEMVYYLFGWLTRPSTTRWVAVGEEDGAGRATMGTVWSVGMARPRSRIAGCIAGVFRMCGGRSWRRSVLELDGHNHTHQLNLLQLKANCLYMLVNKLPVWKDTNQMPLKTKCDETHTRSIINWPSKIYIYRE